MKCVYEARLLDEILFELDCFEGTQNRLIDSTSKELEEYFGKMGSVE